MPAKDSNHKTNEEDETYADRFNIFFMTLTIICEDAAKACDIMNNYNVAWELQTDASQDGEMLLKFHGDRFSAQQAAAIREFVDSLESLPSEAIFYENLRGAHLRALRSEPWSRIRRQARALAKLLALESAKVHRILWPDDLN